MAIYLFIYTMFKEDGTISYKITSLLCGPHMGKLFIFFHLLLRDLHRNVAIIKSL